MARAQSAHHPRCNYERRRKSRSLRLWPTLSCTLWRALERVCVCVLVVWAREWRWCTHYARKAREEKMKERQMVGLISSKWPLAQDDRWSREDSSIKRKLILQFGAFTYVIIVLCHAGEGSELQSKAPGHNSAAQKISCNVFTYVMLV